MIDEFNKELELIPDSHQITIYKLNNASDLLETFASSVTLTIHDTQTKTMDVSTSKALLKDLRIDKTKLDFSETNLKSHEAEILEFEFVGTLNTFEELMKQFKEKRTDKKLDNYIKVKRNNTQVRICSVPFAKGNLRFAYAALVKKGSIFEKFVAKNSLHNDEKKDSYAYNKQSVILQIIAKFLAEKFIEESRSQMTVKFLTVYVMQLLDTGDYFMLEEYLDGNFAKWSNNLGYVNESDYSNTLDAFSHWSYIKTGGYLTVSDLQGLRKTSGAEKEGKFILTDPAISCVERQFTSTDLGEFGITKYFEKHMCNSHCRDLKLPRHVSQPKEDRVPLSKDTKLTPRK